MLMLIVGSIAGIVLQLVIKAKLGYEVGACMIAEGVSDLVTGRIWYEAACINMEFDHYTWIGKLTGHAIFYYFCLYGGLIVMFVGIAMVVAGFYWKLANMAEKVQENKHTGNGESKSNASPSGTPNSYVSVIREKIPAWKQVEMENQNK